MSDTSLSKELAGTPIGNRHLFNDCVEPAGVECGWIARNGEWYPVGWGFHCDFVELYWAIDEYEAEQDHIKVGVHSWDGGPERPTRFQRRTLEALGFLNGTGEPRYREGAAEDVPMARDLRAALDEWKEKTDADTN